MSKRRGFLPDEAATLRRIVDEEISIKSKEAITGAELADAMAPLFAIREKLLAIGNGKAAKPVAVKKPKAAAGWKNNETEEARA